MILCRNPQKFGLQILMLNTETITPEAQIQIKAIDKNSQRMIATLEIFLNRSGVIDINRTSENS